MCGIGDDTLRAAKRREERITTEARRKIIENLRASVPPW
jgi:hypothetical protein